MKKVQVFEAVGEGEMLTINSKYLPILKERGGLYDVITARRNTVFVRYYENVKLVNEQTFKDEKKLEDFLIAVRNLKMNKAARAVGVDKYEEDLHVEPFEGDSNIGLGTRKYYEMAGVASNIEDFKPLRVEIREV